MGGYGPYLDYGTAGVTLSYNLVFATGASAYYANSNGNTLEPGDVVPNVISNNIFVCEHLQPQDENTALKIRSLTPTHFYSNIIYAFGNSTAGMRAVQTNSMPQWYDVQHWANNTYFNAGPGADDFGASWPGQRNWTAWLATGHDSGSTVADPRFYDPAAGDFRLHGDAPALQRGFVPFDTALAGVRPGNLYWWVREAGQQL